jgi:hypothetical protein
MTNNEHLRILNINDNFEHRRILWTILTKNKICENLRHLEVVLGGRSFHQEHSTYSKPSLTKHFGVNYHLIAKQNFVSIEASGGRRFYRKEVVLQGRSEILHSVSPRLPNIICDKFLIKKRIFWVQISRHRRYRRLVNTTQIRRTNFFASPASSWIRILSTFGGRIVPVQPQVGYSKSLVTSSRRPHIFANFG